MGSDGTGASGTIGAEHPALPYNAHPMPASTSPPLAVCAQGLSKAYSLRAHPWRDLRHLLRRGAVATDQSFWALRDVSFDLPRGAVLGVVGRNGAGKSTLLQLLCSTLQPSAATRPFTARVPALTPNLPGAKTFL